MSNLIRLFNLHLKSESIKKIIPRRSMVKLCYEYEFIMNNPSIIHNNIVSNLPRLNRQTHPYLTAGGWHFTSTLKK